MKPTTLNDRNNTIPDVRGPARDSGTEYMLIPCWFVNEIKFCVFLDLFKSFLNEIPEIFY